MEVQIVADRRRHDSGSAVGGRGHDAATSGIFLVDGHGIDRQPIIREHGIEAVRAPLLLQLVMDRLGAAANFQPARQLAFLAQAAVDAACHRIPDPVEAGIEVFAGAHHFLIRPFHLGNRQTRRSRHGEHLLRRREGIGHLLARGLLLLLLHGQKLGIGHDEAAADRIVDLGQQNPAVLVERRQAHAVGVAGQRSLLVVDEIVLRLELVGRMSRRGNPTRALDIGDDRFHAIGIDTVRRLAHQADDHGIAGAMADAGIGQRAMQARLQGGHMGAGRSRPLVGEDEIEKAIGRRHRTHGVGTRGADADLEHVENRKKHGAPRMRTFKRKG